MLFVNCPFCHKRVLRPFYPWHEARHTKLQADGQMTDHITLDPKARYKGSLEDVPSSYEHPECVTETGMPEEIIRSYLANPFLYSENSFCCGCGDYVPMTELFWVETGQSLEDYFRELQEEHRRQEPKGPK